MADDEDKAPHTQSRTKKGRPSPVTILHLASSAPARAGYMVLGALGLVALAVAILGPKRVRQEVVDPLHDAIEPDAEQAWTDAQSLREQIAALLDHATPSGRKQLARSFQSWIGHFRASG